MRNTKLIEIYDSESDRRWLCEALGAIERSVSCLFKVLGVRGEYVMRR